MSAVLEQQQRMDRLLQECRERVISQIIGPFGLSTRMFEDRNGGNVTTLHNFEREDDDYVATESDRVLHGQSRKRYDEEVRAQYEVKTKTRAAAAGEQEWSAKRQERLSAGVDEYTNKTFEIDESGTATRDGLEVRMELDHVVSLNEIHSTPKAHLALGQVSDIGEVDTSGLAALANAYANLALTEKKHNASKGAQDLKDWSDKKIEVATANGGSSELDPVAIDERYRKATEHIEKTIDTALLRKQSAELLSTGCDQAVRMGLRQAMGILLEELVNGLFEEIKQIVRTGVRIGRELLDDVIDRLRRIGERVVGRLPDALAGLFTGGASGFITNLITFLINNLVSTAKRYVTAIREGFLGLVRAFKMIFLPPKGMSEQQALQAGLKLLSTVILTIAGILVGESVVGFLMTVPFLAPIASDLAPVLVGIFTGVLAALVAYYLDTWFARNCRDGERLELLLTNADQTSVMTSVLEEQLAESLATVSLSIQTLESYEASRQALGAASSAGQGVLRMLEHGSEQQKRLIDEYERVSTRGREASDAVDDFFRSKVVEA